MQMSEQDRQKLQAMMMRMSQEKLSPPVTMESQVASQLQTLDPKNMPNSGMSDPYAAAPSPIGQDFSGAERGIQRQMDYANMLRGKAAPQGRTVGPSNIYVAPNWGESLAYGVDQGIGGYMAGRANKADADLDEKRTALKQAIYDQERGDRAVDRAWAVEDRDKDIAAKTEAATLKGGLGGRDYVTKIEDSSGNEILTRINPYDPDSVPEFLMVGEDGKNRWTSDKAAASAAITSETEASAATKKEQGISSAKSNQSRIDGLNEEIPAIQKQVGAYYEAIQAVASNANTGPFAGRIPSFTDASVWLDNIQQELGLAKIAQYTFGSLSEAEGKWVRDSSIPQNMSEEFLGEFLMRKADGAKRMLKARQFERAYREEFGKRPKDGMVDKILYEGGFTYGVPDAWLKKEEEK